MNDAFKIYVDQLKDGHEEDIHEEFSPDFIDVTEKDLSFKAPVKVDGKAYLAEDSLILHLEIETSAEIPCAVCNTIVKTPIAIHNFYHAEPLEEIKSGIYNIQDILRETILIEAPQFAECNEGKCAEREKIAKYLKTEASEEGEDYKPFSNLKLE